MSQNLERLKQLLAEVFQLDQAELDFGIYRIMNTKREEILRFLDQDLLPQVREAFQAYQAENRGAVEVELAEAIEKAKELGADPESLPRVKELRARLAEAVDVTALENEVYSHLYNFFRRYYQEGDFISLRRYKEGVYAIPYEGEEVKLHWANHDQYYIKTSEYLRDYTFKLPSGKRVHFKLVEADTDKDNNRAPNGNERRFILSQEQPLAEENGELVIRFEYRPHPDKAKQADLNSAAVDRILNQTTGFDDWRRELVSLRPTEKNANRTLLEKHLTDYTARNTFDYFIHKDLGGFLRRELDFYIKNEVMHLDDVESETAPRVEQYLSKIKAIRRIAHKIIDFLAQLENFQKKLWLKKKFVVETQYCVTLDRVPEELYPEIAANDAQREEWVRLFAINEIKGNLTTSGYAEPLTTEFLKAHRYLVLDTSHFDDGFRTRLLSEIGDCDEEIDGLLIRSENFQAINLLVERYKKQIACLYIDPPYNTGDSEILYKNEYISASWLTLIENRLALATRALLSDDPVLFIAIDDFEMVDLCELVDTHFPSLRREMIVVNHHPQGGKAKTLASTHEYMLACVARGSDRTLRGRLSKDGVEHRPFKRSGTAESNFRRARPKSFYAILVDPGTKGVVGAEPPPALGSEYPTGPTEEGFLRVYPLGSKGEERVWRRSYESGLALIPAKKLICTESSTIYQLIEAQERTPALFSNWVDPRYNAGTFGANLLGDIIGEHNPFSYPKSIHTVEDAIFSAGLEEGAVCLDFFAGSGTTGHAVINLNRSDGDRRKYILVEMGDWFDTVLLPRIKKVVYSKDWKSGKPVSREGTSHMFKYIRLESYEDTLNNLQLKRTGPQQTLLEQYAGFREDYVLRYMLDVDSRESPSLLNVECFEDPFNYKLNIATGTAGQTKATVVDLVETFNYLIGLRVKTMDDVRGVRVVAGTNPRGERVLILWRKTKELDNDALDAWFRKQGYNTKDQEYDVIYVNGDNNLENLRKPDQTWKVRLIEEEFKRLMFDPLVVERRGSQ
jgi:adenine-specific DNA-methyltransferase